MQTLRLGELEVNRMGYGAMRLPGPGVWGEPADADRAKAVLRRAVELGVTLIDTAWYYGPDVSNRLIVEALHPYPKNLVVATKLGGKRLPDKGWAASARPEELREGHERDLRALKLERIDIVHMRYMPGCDVPFTESLDALIALQREGKIRHIGISNVTLPLLEQALKRTPVVTVQNLYSAIHQGDRRQPGPVHGPPQVESPDVVLEACAARGIAFMPFFPLAIGALGKSHAALDAIAAKRKATPAQIAIAWLLARSPVMLPIPGTSSIEHLEENWAAQKIELSPEEVRAISG